MPRLAPLINRVRGWAMKREVVDFEAGNQPKIGEQPDTKKTPMGRGA
jgi:hypothetical protein